MNMRKLSIGLVPIIVFSVMMTLITVTGFAKEAGTPAPSSIAGSSGELRVAVAYAGLEALDPTMSPGSGKVPLIPIYDFLVGAIPETGKLSTETGIARKWECSADSKTWIFHLREGVTFHNGEKLTAEDVKFSLEYIKRPEARSSFCGELRRMIESVEAPTPYTVIVRTKGPYNLPFVLSQLGHTEGMIVPKDYIEDKGSEYFGLNPIGSGPYKLKEHLSGSHITLEAVDYPHWRIGRPKYKTITIYFVPEETTRIVKLKRGEIDISEISRDRAKEVSDKFRIDSKNSGNVVFVHLANQWDASTYLSSEKVRLALNLAVDKEAILQGLCAGMGRVIGYDWYGSYAVEYEPLPVYPYDPERARKLLAEAYPEGVKLEMWAFTRKGVPELPTISEAVASYWQKVGVDVKIVPIQYSTMRARWKAGDAPNIAAGMAAGNRPLWSSGQYLFMHSEGMLTYCKIPELDQLLEERLSQVKIERMGECELRCAKYVREHHLTLPLFELDNTFASNAEKVPPWDLGKIVYGINLQALYTHK